MRLAFEYVFASALIAGGLLTVWIGPDAEEANEKTRLTPRQRVMMRAFGAILVLCGVGLLIATLLGFRGRPGNGPLF